MFDVHDKIGYIEQNIPKWIEWLNMKPDQEGSARAYVQQRKYFRRRHHSALNRCVCSCFNLLQDRSYVVYQQNCYTTLWLYLNGISDRRTNSYTNNKVNKLTHSFDNSRNQKHAFSCKLAKIINSCVPMRFDKFDDFFPLLANLIFDKSTTVNHDDSMVFIIYQFLLSTTRKLYLVILTLTPISFHLCARDK